ncbi:MAG: ribosome small subunit-dependent GTPase A [Candidatus Pacebacteria bacterium]|nr:ribosome small subunit-dependent GTPase A [Candidatus Paceibacterota bacterium]
MDNNNKITELEDLGYDDFFEAGRLKLGFGGFAVARVVAEYRGAYRVKDPDGEYMAKITGKQMLSATSREDYPAVGDWVAITAAGEGQAVIEGTLPRKTIIKRKSSGKNEIQIIATNIDVALVVQAVDGDYSLNRFERYFSISRDGGVRPAIVLNKIDLIPKEGLDLKVGQIKERFGDVEMIVASATSDRGLDGLKSYIKEGKTYCLLGSSGVGKSSLINKLIGKEAIKTNQISAGTDRGRHTTTHREMYLLENGGIVIDNPGMREVGMTDANAGINDIFAEIAVLAEGCKFSDCRHAGEPGCNVAAAVRDGKLDEEKYNNYIGLKKESEYYEMNDLEKREKDRQFGKFIKKAKDQLKRNEY